MAHRDEEAVWTNHAEQHRADDTIHSVDKGSPLYKWINELPPSRVLDLGCGSGLWRDFFTKHTYLGMDQNARMIEVAKWRREEEADRFYNIPWNQIPLEDGALDLVFTSAVIQHNSHPEKDKVLGEIWRVLKPGGLYVCTENTLRLDNYATSFPKGTEWSPGMSDGYSFTPEGWKNFLSERGFKMEEYSAPSEYKFRRE